MKAILKYSLLALALFLSIAPSAHAGPGPTPTKPASHAESRSRDRPRYGCERTRSPCGISNDRPRTALEGVVEVD